MTTIVGGLRARLIRESLFEMLEDSLDQLGWFDTDRPHSPLTFVSRSHNQDEPIEANTAGLSDEDLQGTELELGSMLTQHDWTMWVDFFAEDDAIGLHFIRDVKDILEGRMSVIGRDRPNFACYDYRQATPDIFTTCGLENVITDKARGFTHPWLQHWYACSFTVVDAYNTDES